MLLRTFGYAFAVTVGGLIAAFLLGGAQALGLVAILAVLEISLSFDNAVVNATVLRRMSEFWQKIFLTVGILIAVFGMRLIFPLLVVAITARINPIHAVQLAVNDPHQYAARLTDAHPAIAAFGGMFLAMIFLNFVFEEHEITWLGPIERALAKLGKIDAAATVIALLGLFVAAETVGTHERPTVLGAGVLGIAIYLAVDAIGSYFENAGAAGSDDATATDGIHGAADGARPRSAVGLAGKAALALFLYLEVLDASFSFDGVVGAFAISSDIFIIAGGLGIGAMYIRSLTVFLVRAGTLDDYVYLEHGAHYAIGALAALLFVTITHSVPELITGLVGIAFIAAAFVSSLVRNKRAGGDPEPDDARARSLVA